MRGIDVNAVALLIGLSLLGGCAAPPTSTQPVTAYEGARLIVIDSATLIVQGDRIAQAGPTGAVRVPAGATRVSLAGKTAMPMLIDTHVHLSATRDGIVRDLRQRAYYGVSAALSLGTDDYDKLDLRSRPIPGAARFLSAGRGLTTQEPGRTQVPYWVTSEADARKAVQELAANKVDIVKIWVDTREGKYQKLTPALYGAIIDEEMQDMVIAGMTPMQVIVAATRNSAEFLRLTDAGTLEPGKSADFIVLDENPLDDITNTRRISMVILRGQTVDRTQPVR